jgi:hypothetical protein
MLYLKSFGIWFLLAIVAIILGSLRNAFLLPAVGDLTAHHIGTAAFLICQFIIIYFFIKRISERATHRVTPTTLFMIGLFWVALTAVFEFLFGHYVIGHSWEKLLADYNIFKGRLWVLVLLNNIASPLISGRIIKLKRAVS